MDCELVENGVNPQAACSTEAQSSANDRARSPRRHRLLAAIGPSSTSGGCGGLRGAGRSHRTEFGHHQRLAEQRPVRSGRCIYQVLTIGPEDHLSLPHRRPRADHVEQVRLERGVRHASGLVDAESVPVIRGRMPGRECVDAPGTCARQPGNGVMSCFTGPGHRCRVGSMSASGAANGALLPAAPRSSARCRWCSRSSRSWACTPNHWLCRVIRSVADASRETP